MDDGPILEKLIEKLVADKWVGWGAPVVERLTEEVTRVLAECVGQPVPEVSAALLGSGDRSRFLLVKLLSATGHALVFVGVDRMLARRVALKIHRTSRDHATQRAISEGQLMAKLKHPNIVEIHDMGEHSTVAIVLDRDTGQKSAVRFAWIYCVMDLCETDLEKACHQSPHKWPQILDCLIGAARGLAHLHERRYIHGDIKPSNVLLSDGIAKLSDFGFSKKHHTRPFERPGTAGYASPDVLEHGASVAGDLFAFAVTAWRCLYGELPYPIPPGADIKQAYLAVTLQAQAHQIAEPSITPPGLPVRLRLALEQALHPQPEQRPELDDIIAAMVAARDRHEKRQQRLRRLPRRIAGGIAVLVVGITIGAMQFGASGAGSLYAAARRNLDPLTRAEIAAQEGNGEVVVAELNRMDSLVRKMSGRDLDGVIARTDHIVDLLKSTSPDHAVVVQAIAEYYRRLRVKATTEAQPRSR